MQYFRDYPLHKKLVDQFKRNMQNNKLAHAYLFYGSEGSGKDAFALELAKAVNCLNKQVRPCNDCSACNKINQLIHPDIHFLFPVSAKWKTDDIKNIYKDISVNPYRSPVSGGTTNISIEQIRKLKNESKYPPHEAEQKFYIISDADKMNRESANSFLKLLEEPPGYITIILTTSSKDSLLDTIRSRCRPVYFPCLRFEETLSIVKKFKFDLDKETESIIRLSQGNLNIVFEALNDNFKEKRQHVINYLRAAASGSPHKISESVEQLYLKRDKILLLEILNLVILWFKDVLNLVYLDDSTTILNTDFSEELLNFTRYYKQSNFGEIIKIVEQTISTINKNVYPPLALTLLAYRMNKILVRKK